MNGVLNINKPSGISSFDVVRRIMKVSNTKKVGHTGTLDPLASGVLPICLGNATKIVDYIMSETKTYEAELMLGVVTDTYDREGKVIEENKVNLKYEDIVEVFQSFCGEIEQVPPMFSALKVNGKRLYELARKGIVVEREKRKVNIISLDLVDISLPMIKFVVKCSKGTYIRSLCYDIGEKLGTGGTMWNLERIQTGTFRIEESLDFNDITSENIQQKIVPVEDALASYEKVFFNSKYEKLLLNGVKIKNEFIIRHIQLNKLSRVYIEDGTFIGLGIRDEEGFKIVKLLV